MHNAKRYFMRKIGNTDENGVYITDDDILNIISANVKEYLSSIN